MASRSILRMCHLRPIGSDADLDASIRRLYHETVRSLNPGVVYAGRRGPDERSERVIVSVWPTPEAMVAALGEGSATAPSAFEDFERVDGRDLQMYPIALSLTFEHSDRSRILRVFNGEVRPGELDDYVEEVRSGTHADVAASQGPHALYLAIDPPQRFVTVSVWPDWSRIEAATGGNIRQPVATQHLERLVGGNASHYELLPDPAPLAAEVSEVF